MRWFASTGCSARVHCVACRTNAVWRESLRKAGLVDSAEFECPHGVTPETAAPIQAKALDKVLRSRLSEKEIEAQRKDREARKIEKENQGRAAWQALHEKAEGGEITAEWLKDIFEPMIPRYGCSCLKEWNQILKDNPLPSAGEQASWAVTCHNAVNVKMGKPVWVDKTRNLG